MSPTRQSITCSRPEVNSEGDARALTNRLCDGSKAERRGRESVGGAQRRGTRLAAGRVEGEDDGFGSGRCPSGPGRSGRVEPDLDGPGIGRVEGVRGDRDVADAFGEPAGQIGKRSEEFPGVRAKQSATLDELRDEVCDLHEDIEVLDRHVVEAVGMLQIEVRCSSGR